MCSLSLPPLITSTSQCSPRTRLLRAHPLKSALMLRMRRPFSKQICRRQLKSITSQTAPPKWHVVHQPSPHSRLQNVQHSATFDLTFLCMSDVMRLKANTCFFFFYMYPYGKILYVLLKCTFQNNHSCSVSSCCPSFHYAWGMLAKHNCKHNVQNSVIPKKKKEHFHGHFCIW